MTGDLGALCAHRNLGVLRQPELAHDIRHQELTIEKVVILACVVSDNHLGYSLGQYQCYWYANTVWTIACQLAGINNSDPPPSNVGTNSSLGAVVRPPQVPAESQPDALREVFNQRWETFLEEATERRAVGPTAQADARVQAVQEEARIAAEDKARKDAAEIQALKDKARAAEDKALEREAKIQALEKALQAQQPAEGTESSSE
ncbi:hypothetical protein FRC10_010829 [Ceratobasidium sp. 414]|nr:hypothetical protein FRC10_010829 [Ceratobasidium sp. 414]